MLRRTKERMIGGVCGSIAKFTGMDVTIVRIVFTLLFFMTSAPMLFLYIICWIIMPKEK